MRGRRVLLIESLDAAGSSLADASLRARAIDAAGFEATAVAFAGRTVMESDGARHGGDSNDPPLHRDRATLMAAIEEVEPELVIVASAQRGGGPVAQWLPARLEARWWPSGICSRVAVPHFPGRRAQLQALHPPRRGAEAMPVSGLEWTVVESAPVGRRRLGLWDGDYVLSPVPLEGSPGRDALIAFAAVAHERDSLDLVLLAPPHPDLLRLSRRLGVATRVHFAGTAARVAEHGWAIGAAATLIACAAPLGGGAVMRALASGSPILAAGGRGASRLLRGWLERHGLSPGAPGTEAPDLAHQLDRLVERGPQVERAIASGRALAEQHLPPAVGARIADALAGDGPSRRAA